VGVGAVVLWVSCAAICAGIDFRLIHIRDLGGMLCSGSTYTYAELEKSVEWCVFPVGSPIEVRVAQARASGTFGGILVAHT
jgi:hypothetical protein